MTTPVLELRGVAKAFGWRRPRPALREVWLRVERGECFGLAGPNGAGKTTLIRLMLGLALPDAGEVRLFGASPEDPELRRRVGFVPEAAELSPHATPRELVTRWARLRGLPPSTRDQGVAALERLGVKALLDRPVGRFSKGEKQRTLLALALLGSPELLVLDEPTDGLDPLGRALVRQVLREERAAGRTIFLNSHLLSETEKMCTRVGILHRGRLARLQAIQPAASALGTSVVVVREPPSAAVLEAAGARVRPARASEDGRGADPPAGHALLVDHPSLEALNQSLDVLRHAGALVMELRPQRADLETALVEVATSRSASADREEVPAEELGRAGADEGPVEPPAWGSEPVPALAAVPPRPLRALDAIRRVAQEIAAELAAQRIGWMLLGIAVLMVLVLVRILKSDLFQSATQATRAAIAQLDALGAANLARMAASTASEVLYWGLLALLTLMSSMFAVPLLDPRRTVLLFAQPLSRADHVLGLFTAVVSLASLAALLYAAAVVGVFRWFGLDVSWRMALLAVPLGSSFAALYAVVLLATLVRRNGLFAGLCGGFALWASVALGSSVSSDGGPLAVLYAGAPKLLELGRLAGRIAEGAPLVSPPLVSTWLVTAGLVVVLVVVSSRRET